MGIDRNITATVPIVAAALLLTQCSTPTTHQKAAENQHAAQIESRASDAVRLEFQQIASRLRDSSNRYLGTAQIAQISRQLANEHLTTDQQTDLQLQLCFHQLRLGDIDGANQSIERAFQLIATPTTAMLRAKALVSLRAAEVSNCVSRHHRQCCIFPLEGGGAHSDKLPAQQAKETLFQVLRREPGDLLAQWLVNIAGMALEEYPDGIPESFRIPPSALESEFNIGTFVDVAPDLGLDQFNLCGGVIVEDFDRDGMLDIVSSTSDPAQSLTFHRNNGDGSFADLTKASQLDAQLGGLNLVAADYDNDGDIDILVLRGAWLEQDGEIRNSLLRNDGVDLASGSAVFADVTHAAGLADRAFPTQTAAWGDFNNDGWLDLFVGNESLVEVTEGKTGNYPCQLFLNQGDGTFVDVAGKSAVTNDRFAKGVASGDFDNDGDLDIYVSNVGRNRLYRNDGVDSDGVPKFQDVAAKLALTGPEDYSFAPWFFDFNNDGWLDIWVAAYRASPADVLADLRGQRHHADVPRLYVNRGDGTFRDTAEEANLHHPYLPMGANFGDLDNDGNLDIYLATGDPSYETLMPNIVLRNDQGVRFQNVTFASGLGHLQKGHGVAFADIDHDGDQDVYNQLGGFYPGDKFHNALFLNPGHGNHHLTIQFVGKTTNRFGLGVRLAIDVSTPQGRRTIHRAVGAVSSFGGSPISRAEIGLGNATAIDRITVTWPTSKTTQEFVGVPLDQMVRISEGDDDVELIETKIIPLDSHALDH